MVYYVIGEDKSLAESYSMNDLQQILNEKLSTTGGTMTGNISFSGSMTISEVIKFLDNAENSNGNGIVIGGGGLTMICGGDAAANADDSVTAETESVIIASDTVISFYTNVQNGLDSGTKVELSKTGILSGHQKAITSGTAAPSGGSNGDIYIQY